MKRPTPARLSYIPQDIIRLARMAGAGASGSEAAEALGIAPGRIHQLASRHQIAFERKTPHEEAVLLILPKTTVARAGRLAIERGIDPRFMLVRLIEAVVAEPVLAANLLDEDAA